MTDRHDTRERLTAIDGVDDAALGLDDEPSSAPPGAEVDATRTRVPGPMHPGPPTEPKPWSTSLAFDSEQAGVANEPAEDDDVS